MNAEQRQQCKKTMDALFAYLQPKIRLRMLLWGESVETAILAIVEGKEDRQP